MIRTLRVTTVVENSVFMRGLLGQHGLSFLIEADGRRILFDTGQGKVILENARQLDLRLDTVETVVLSHGHYDHTGGLADVLHAGGGRRFLLHPAALEPKYVRRQNPPHPEIGIPESSRQALESNQQAIVWTQTPTEVLPGLLRHRRDPQNPRAWKTWAARSTSTSRARILDPLLDDQALFADCAAGLVVIFGCAHSGVINTLEYVAQLTGRSRIHAVLGGMHLLQASSERIEATADALERHGVERIMPCHCTGSQAMSLFRARFGDRFRECPTGTSHCFERRPRRRTDFRRILVLEKPRHRLPLRPEDQQQRTGSQGGADVGDHPAEQSRAADGEDHAGLKNQVRQGAYQNHPPPRIGREHPGVDQSRGR